MTCAAHHWLIDPPAGATSAGVCRLCGAERLERRQMEKRTWNV